MSNVYIPTGYHRINFPYLFHLHVENTSGRSDGRRLKHEWRMNMRAGGRKLIPVPFNLI